MIAEYNRKGLMLGIPGLLLQLVCLFMTLLIKARSDGNLPPEAAALVVIATALIVAFALGSLAGTILLIAGLCYYAKAKGYSAVLGLLGLLSGIGLILLAVLPDKTKGQNGNAPNLVLDSSDV